MVTPAKRFQGWIDTLAEAWKVRLRDWMVDWLAAGLELILDIIGRGMGNRLDTIIDTFGAKYDIPADILAEVKDAWKGEGEWQAILGGAAGGTAVGSLIGSTIGPWLKLLEYKGLDMAEPFRFDPSAIIRLWLRDKPLYEKLFKDLEEQGWSPGRITDLKELGKIFPPLPDMVRFADYGSFDPAIIEEWREMYDAPGFITKPFETIGITNEPPWEWASKYWFSHWTQPGRFELNDMFRRGLLSGKAYPAGRTMTPAEIEEGRRILKITYLTQGFSSYWQDKLADTVKEIPTRVDVRRFWDMRTISEDRLREIYQARGYFDQDLEDYVLWTKVYVGFPDLMARWSKGWITLDDVRTELTALGMPAARVEEMIQTKVKAEQPARLEKERDLTKTDIYKGVKQDRIAREEAVELLIDLGFDADEAEYLLSINIPEDEEDPVAKARLLSKTDIRAGFLATIIPETDARTKLLALRYSAADADLLMRIFKAAIKPEVIEEARDLTKSDTLRLFKLAIIGEAEARIMLGDLNYKPEDITRLIAANMPPEEEAKIEEARQLTKADIKTGLRTGLLTVPQVQSRLEALGYTPDDTTLLIELYQRVDSLRPSVQPREASKADVVLGVKKGLLTQEEGYGMLLDLDFSPEASAFILTVRTEESPFSPVNYTEFKELTHKYRIASGREERPMTEELKAAAGEVVRVTGEVESLQRSVETEKRKLIKDEVVPEAAAKRLTDLQVKLHRAESELAMATTEYKSQLAEWRHGLPE